MFPVSLCMLALKMAGLMMPCRVLVGEHLPRMRQITFEVVAVFEVTGSLDMSTENSLLMTL